MRWAVADERHAERMRGDGEQPFDRLRDTRAGVRRAAAAMVRDCGDDGVAAVVAEMMGNVRRLWVREPPFVGFDVAMLEYTAARAWQGCALQLDPTVPIVQGRWD